MKEFQQARLYLQFIQVIKVYQNAQDAREQDELVLVKRQNSSTTTAHLH